MPQADDFLITSGFASLPPPSPPRTERERIEAWIEAHLSAADALILCLDGADGDCDLEDNGDGEPANGDEPSLGWTAGIDQCKASKQCWDDCLGEGAWADCEADRADDEPSLGSLDGEVDQRRWGEGDRLDREADYTRFFAGFGMSAFADGEADSQREREV